MKTFSVKEKHAAPVLGRTRPYTHVPLGPKRKAQQAQIRRILRSTGAQAKLTIGQPNDRYEQEADHVADQVMVMPDPRLQRQPENEEEEETLQTKPLADQITPLVQRREESPDEEKEVQGKLLQKEADEEEEIQKQPEEQEETAQAKGDGGPSTASSAVESDINSLRGGGQPLPGCGAGVGVALGSNLDY